MGLLYMISDTELTNGEVLKTESGGAESRKCASSSKAEKERGVVQVGRKNRTPRMGRLCLLVPYSIMLSALAVLVYQGCFWFKYGWWKSVKASVVLYEVLPASLVQWIRSGTSWSGINHVVSFVFNTPLFLFLLVCGFAVRVLIDRAFGLLRRFEKPQEKLSWRG